MHILSLIRKIKAKSRIKVEWVSLARLHELKAVQSTYIWIIIVPVLAKALEKAEDTARVTVFCYTFDLSLALPFSWVMFYFSALAFASSFSVYILRCPRIIKDHRGYADFADARKGVSHLDKYLHEAEMNWAGVDKIQRAMAEHFSDTHEVGDPESPDDDLRKKFWVVFNFAQTIRPWSRGFIALLSFLGATLLIIVLSQNFLFVLRFITR